MAGPVRVLLATLLAAGLLSGCAGGGSKVKEANRYVDAVNRAQNHFATTVDQLSKRITDKSTPAQDRTTLQGFEGAVDRVATELRAIHPPGRVRDLHARLIGLFATFRDQVDKARSELAKPTATGVVDAQERISRATVDVSRGINETVAAINTALNK